MTQIDGVNLAANSLVESNHPRSMEVKKCQDHPEYQVGCGEGSGDGGFFSSPLGVWPRSQEALPLHA